MERRTFLKWAIHGMSAVFGAILGVPAVAYLIDARNRPARDAGFKIVEPRLSELEVGVPKQALIRDLRHDAWTYHPNDVVGRVWLIRGKNDEVKAFTTTCPHLGCSVNFIKEDSRFVCPCHNGTFDANGQLVESSSGANPAPRGMDSLEIQLMPDPTNMVDDPSDPGKKKQDSRIAVKYQNFIQGLHEKKART